MVTRGYPCTENYKLLTWWGVFVFKVRFSLSNLTVAKKIQHTVPLNINVIPPNVCDISSSLKEWSDNKAFSMKMGLYLSLYSVKNTENDSVSLTLIAKVIVEIQMLLGHHTGQLLVWTSTSKVTKFR